MRIIGYCALILIALTTPLPVFLFGALLYLFFWSGYEILIITVIIDSVFGPSPTSALYTLLVGTLVILFTLLRPYVSWHTTRV